jgi:hypothetical protein
MAPKNNCKSVHDIMVEEPTHDLYVPFKTIREEGQKDSKK